MGWNFAMLFSNRNKVSEIKTLLFLDERVLRWTASVGQSAEGQENQVNLSAPTQA